MSRSDQAKKIFFAMTDVDEKFIAEADAAPEENPKHKGILRHIRPVYFAAIAAACILLLLAGKNIINIITPDDRMTSDTAQTACPVEEVTSMKKAAAKTGFTLDIPEKIGKYKNVVICVYTDSMIEASYSETDRDNIRFDVRKAKAAGPDDDISGIYEDFAVTGTKNINGHAVTLKGTAGNYEVATWTADGYSYSISSTYMPLDLAEMTDIINNTK